jgi:peptidoglycan/LPS O-acetylase OafA/YrhL
MTVIEGELRALIGVRAFAATAVVAWHGLPILVLMFPGITARENIVFGFAVLAVDFFFMLSGFILTEKYLAAMSRPSWSTARYFYTLRFARIWPVHAAMVIAFVVANVVALHGFGFTLTNVDDDPLNIVLNLLLLNGVPPATSINGPAWSIGVEVGAYALFPLAALVLARFRTPSAAFGSAAIMLVAGATIYGPLYEGADHAALTYGLPAVRITFGFLGGALLNIGWRSLSGGRYGRGWDVVLIAAVTVASVATVITGWSGPFVIPILAYPFLGLAVLASAGATGVVGRLLGSGPIEWCGRLSYSLYMTHFLVVTSTLWLLRRSDAETLVMPVRVLLLGLSAALVAVIAVVTYYVLEEPARRAIRRRARRRGTDIRSGGSVRGT